ncbi:MAG: DUF1629 domain-containing protein [Pseudomonadota bacterium]
MNSIGARFLFDHPIVLALLVGLVLILLLLERTRRLAQPDAVFSSQAGASDEPTQSAPAVVSPDPSAAQPPWVSQLFSQSGLAQGYTPTEIPEDRKVLGAFSARVRLGKRPDPLPCLGTTKSTNSPPKAIKDIMVTNGQLLLVSDPLKQLLQEATDGASVFYPTVIYNASETEVLSTAHSYWVIGASKETLQVDQSTGLRPVTKDETSSAYGTFHPPLTLSDGQVCLSDECLKGSRVWVEPRLRSTVFFDDAFVQVLKRNNLDRLFGFRRCDMSS